ncbi:MAG TPA: TetR/AcrR family transcriptional regulator [Candidatus Saccharimonadales bacterium]|jgi:AcrR family transcriptional regulator|nr:TetR/AcrR family transcriptional regulator [Candidatus Saccharimonadales bacterium]
MESATADRSALSPSPGLAPRERILAKAGELFYRFGIHTVGVDRIIKESDVAKMTFYKYFPSKSKLIAAYLRYRNELWLHALREIAGRDAPVLDRILAVFDLLDHAFHAPDFQGCPFIKASAEFGGDQQEQEILSEIASHFQQTEDIISGLIGKLAVGPDLARTTISLLFGSIIVAQSVGHTDIAQTNKTAVRILLSHI